MLNGTEARNGVQKIDAEVPLAEMFGYVTALRSSTQGRGTFTMEPYKFVEVPKIMIAYFWLKKEKWVVNLAQKEN